jgi:sarcosine oxidase subunit beta
VAKVDRWAAESTAFLRQLPADFPADPCYRPTGSFLLGSSIDRQQLEPAGAQRSSAAALQQACGWFEPRADAEVLFCPNDGVIDIQAYREGFLDGARSYGAQIWNHCRVLNLESQNGRITALRTAGGRVRTASVILAAGAWSEQLAASAGAPRVGLRITRRHLAVSEPLPDVDPEQPYVWDLDLGFYGRPEGSGLLLCACDEDPWVAEDCPADPRIVARLREKWQRCLPSREFPKLVRFWAGLRTFASDRAFQAGADRHVQGLFWAGGLGGHGVTTAPAVGRAVAEAWLSESPSALGFSPDQTRK